MQLLGVIHYDRNLPLVMQAPDFNSDCQFKGNCGLSLTPGVTFWRPHMAIHCFGSSRIGISQDYHMGGMVSACGSIDAEGYLPFPGTPAVAGVSSRESQWRVLHQC